MLNPALEDQRDPIAPFRKKFLIPQKDGREQIYFLGNSLGLQPTTTASHINDILSQWSQYGVEGFFHGDDPWLHYHNKLTGPLARITGAKPSEIVVMNHLTVNLHLLLASFYRPNEKRYRIICEANAFSSDQYVLESHVKHYGMDPADTIIEVHPREGEYHIRTEDIESVIKQHATSLALVLWGGVHYYSGEVADMQKITQLAHKAGAIAGFDLAHAIGNIALQLHEWNVDFACWCSYKYLNAGPGAIGGAYIHERYHNDKSIERLAGWWGYEEASRFRMERGFRPTTSALGWQLSTPPIILMAALLASLEIFDEAGIGQLIAKGKKLSDYLVYLINDINNESGKQLISIITPAAKGCQVSMIVNSHAREVFEQLAVNGIFADWREPAVIRVAPVPLYNTFTEVQRFSEVVKKLIA